MKRVALLGCLLVPGLAGAQTNGQDAPAPVRINKIVRVHYGDPRTLASMAASSTGLNYEWDNSLRAIVLKGPPAVVAEVERTIHELDVPASVPVSKDVEVTVSVLGASGKPGAYADGEVPASLGPVVKQIGAIFPYKSYALLSSMLMRSREGGKAENQGVMQGISSGFESPYKLAYDEANASSVDGRPLLHLRNFRFAASARIPVGSQSFQTSDIGLLTDVDLREGEKVVVGKASTGDSDSALFVILSARLAD